MTEKHPGRPAAQTLGQDDARSKLLAAARHCFLKLPYAKVTTRQIAEHAGVNKALINYYFDGKQGLFKAMMLDIVQPVLSRLKQARRDGEHSLEGVMMRFADVMSDNMDFPPLISQVLLTEDHPLREDMIAWVLRPAMKEISGLIRHQQENGQLDPAVSPERLMIAVHSLLVGPMLLRPLLSDIMEKPLGKEFILEQAQFNSRLVNQVMQSSSSHE